MTFIGKLQGYQKYQNGKEIKAFPSRELAEWRGTLNLEDLIPALFDLQATFGQKEQMYSEWPPQRLT